MLSIDRHSPTLFNGADRRIELLPEGVVYLHIDHDAEVTGDEARATLQCIHALSMGPPLLLIDRRRRYWLSFEAHEVLRRHDQLSAVAYWVQRRITHDMVEYAMDTYFDGTPVRVFGRRAPAVEWLTTFMPVRV